jgi:hypothetical protein
VANHHGSDVVCESVYWADLKALEVVMATSEGFDFAVNYPVEDIR